MAVVPEADPEEESDYRRTTLRTTANNEVQNPNASIKNSS